MISSQLRRTDPGASGGIDLDSDLITDLAAEHPNIIGVKLTCVTTVSKTTPTEKNCCRCGNVGKLTRICATTTESAFVDAHPRKGTPQPFLVLGGFSDILLTSLYANGHGVITGLGNVAPVSHTSASSCPTPHDADHDHIPSTQSPSYTKLAKPA